jgi:hypothetical protein
VPVAFHIDHMPPYALAGTGMIPRSISVISGAPHSSLSIIN